MEKQTAQNNYKVLSVEQNSTRPSLETDSKMYHNSQLHGWMLWWHRAMPVSIFLPFSSAPSSILHIATTPSSCPS